MLPVVYHNDYVAPLPDGHRFPMDKFRRIHDVLIRDHVISEAQVHTPQPTHEAHIGLVHSQDYISSYVAGTMDRKAMRRIGLPWTEQLVRRTLTAVGGTLLTAELALKTGVACNTASRLP